MVSFLTGFAKGVFDGINEDAAAQRQFEYDQRLSKMQEDAKKKDLNKTFINVNGVDYTYELANPDIYSKGGENFERVSLNNLVKQSNLSRPELDNKSIIQHLNDVGDYTSLQKIADVAGEHSSILTQVKKTEAGVSYVTPLNFAIDAGPFWNKVYKPQAERTSGRVIVRDLAKTQTWLNDPEEGMVFFGEVVKPKENELGEEKQVQPFLLKTRGMKVVKGVDQNNKPILENITNQDVVNFLDKKAAYLNITDAVGQEDLRDKVLGDYINGPAMTTEDGRSVNFSISDQIKAEMSMMNLFPEGYRANASNIGRIRAAAQIIDKLPKEVRESPKMLVQIMRGAFRDSQLLTEVNQGGISNDVKSFLDVMGFKNIEKFTEAISNIDKPLTRVKDIKKMYQANPALKDSKKIGGAASAVSFISGVKSQMSQFTQMVTGEKANVLTGVINRLAGDEDSATYKSGDAALLKQQNDDLAQNLMSINEALQGTGLNQAQIDKLTQAQAIAVVKYQTFLLAFEMAAAVQGGGDSRTISNKDVELMQKALTISFFTNPDNFLKILDQIEIDLTRAKMVNRYWQTAIQSDRLSELKAAAVLENTSYNIASQSGNVFGSLASKYMGTALQNNPNAERRLEQEGINIEDMLSVDSILGGQVNIESRKEKLAMSVKDVVGEDVTMGQWLNSLKEEANRLGQGGGTTVVIDFGNGGDFSKSPLTKWEELAKYLGYQTVDELADILPKGEIQNEFKQLLLDRDNE